MLGAFQHSIVRLLLPLTSVKWGQGSLGPTHSTHSGPLGGQALEDVFVPPRIRVLLTRDCLHVPYPTGAPVEAHQHRPCLLSFPSPWP